MERHAVGVGMFVTDFYPITARSPAPLPVVLDLATPHTLPQALRQTHQSAARRVLGRVRGRHGFVQALAQQGGEVGVVGYVQREGHVGHACLAQAVGQVMPEGGATGWVGQLHGVGGESGTKLVVVWDVAPLLDVNGSAGRQ